MLTRKIYLNIRSSTYLDQTVCNPQELIEWIDERLTTATAINSFNISNNDFTDKDLDGLYQDAIEYLFACEWLDWDEFCYGTKKEILQLAKHRCAVANERYELSKQIQSSNTAKPRNAL